MDLKEKLGFSIRAGRVLLLKRRTPLIVGWNITYRCNLRCAYCHLPQSQIKELDEAQIRERIDELAFLGTRMINFSGGEPLLREDLGRIISYCREQNIHVGVSTNGMLVNERLANLADADEVHLSLDGPREINDSVRGKGNYDKVLEAIEICKKAGKYISLCTVISAHNLDHLSYVIDLARSHNIDLYFQPTDSCLSGDSAKPLDVLPEADAYRRAIELIIKEKAGVPDIINHSLPGLKHLARWPEPAAMNCLVSRVYCTIEPDGTICICDMIPNYRDRTRPVENNFRQTLEMLTVPEPCTKCWCGWAVELNLLTSLQPGILSGLWRRFHNKG